MKAAERVYRCLLHLYPIEFRLQHGDAMVQLFRDQLRSRREGAIGWWRSILWDLLRSAPREWLHSRGSWAALCAILLAGGLSWTLNLLWRRSPEFRAIGWDNQFPWPASLLYEISYFACLNAFSWAVSFSIFLIEVRRFSRRSMLRAMLFALPVLLIVNPVFIWTYFGNLVWRTLPPPAGYVLTWLAPVLLALIATVSRDRRTSIVVVQ